MAVNPWFENQLYCGFANFDDSFGHLNLYF